MADVLERAGCTLDFPEDQTCCGQPAFNSGYRDEARTVARHFLKVFKDAEYIVVPSGSCTLMCSHHFADLFARNLAQRFAVAPHGREENHEVLYRASEHRADDDPQCSRKVAELCGQHGADERTRSGDGGEVVAEDDPFVGGLEIVAIAEAFGGSGPLVIEHHYARGDEFRIEAISERIGAGRGQHQPDAIDMLAASNGDCTQADRGAGGDSDPEEPTEELHV